MKGDSGKKSGKENTEKRWVSVKGEIKKVIICQTSWLDWVEHALNEFLPGGVWIKEAGQDAGSDSRSVCLVKRV